MEKVISNNNVKSTRDISIDIYKAFLIFLIALGHTMVTSNPLMNWLQGIHVAGFFLVAGLTYKEYKNFGKFAFKKIIRLLLPYFLVSLISILIFYLFGDYVSLKLEIDIKSTNIPPNLIGMLYGNGDTGYMKWNLPLWFIPALFSALMIYYWVRKLANIFVHKNLVYLFLIFVFISFDLLNINLFHLNNLVFGIEDALHYMPFIFLGEILKNIFTKYEIKLCWKLLFGFVMLSIGSFLILSKSFIFVDSPSNQSLLFYLSSSLANIGLLLLFKTFTCGRFFAAIGKHSLFILLFHKFPIVLFQLYTKKYLKNIIYLDIISSILVSAIVIIILMIIAHFISKLAKVIFKRRKKKAI